MEQRLWQRAVAELSLVPGDGLPPHAMRATHKNLGTCLLRQGEAAAAISHLEMAAAQGADAEVEAMLAMAKSAPDQAIDRTVDSKGLKDSERPMWEAFETQKTRPASKPMR
jgi:hypothetical protein